MDIQRCSLTQLRDQMADLVDLVSRGHNSYRLTDHNKDTGAILAPVGLLSDSSGETETGLVARLLKVAPGRLATAQELEAR